MKVRTLHGRTLEALEAQLKAVLSTSFSPTLAFVFSSPACPFKEMAHLLGQQGIQVVGCTTAGEILDDQVMASSMVVMLLDPPPDAFRVYFNESDNKSTTDLGKALGYYATVLFENPGILVFSGGLIRDGEALVNGIQAGTQRDVPLFGGLAGDDFKMMASHAFTHEGSTDDGIVALIMDQSRLNMQGMASSGWQPVGIKKVITRSEGNVVFRIDDEPALDVLIKYFGLDEGLDLKKDIVETFGVQHPLFVYQPDGSTVMRAPLMGFRKSRAILCAGTVPQGAEVRFGLPPTPGTIHEVINDAEILRLQNQQADALLMFSCIARHMALGPMMTDEVAGVRNVWDAPMAGLFTYGEIGAFQGRPSAFHNETCMLVTLRAFA